MVEQILGVNWRTTAAALVAVGAAITELSKALDGDASTVFSLETFIAQAAIVFGLLHARDAKVTSEKAGAK